MGVQDFGVLVTSLVRNPGAYVLILGYCTTVDEAQKRSRQVDPELPSSERPAALHTPVSRMP